ncbi:MAG TPA: hemolysin family protein [Terriglobia bacterium]|nr:hemolysin family protein [Terriglobia bacterium]
MSANTWIEILAVLGLAVLVALSSFASYLRLLMRRLTPVAARKVFPPPGDGRVAADRERVGISISALHGAFMASFAAGLALLIFSRVPNHLWEDLGTTLLIVLGVIALFDQLIPFILVARHDEPETILLHWSGLLRASVTLAVFLTFPILVSTTINRLLEADEPEEEPPTPQEDLQDFLEVGEQEGLIAKEEGDMLQSVVEFGDKQVREVMTPRPEIAAIDVDASVEELRALFRQKRHTRLPVYRDTLDQIEGIVSMGDLMELSPEAQSQATLRSLVRPVSFVPETKRTKDLLKELQTSTRQIVLVIDEYGSVTGLVTIEDLLEEIVGEIRDEVEPHDRDIVTEAPHSYLVAGHTEIAQLAETVGRPLEAGDYSTVAGLVLAQLGRVPVRGEKVETQGLLIEVLEANARAVLKVRVRLAPEKPAETLPPSPPARVAASKIRA